MLTLLSPTLTMRCNQVKELQPFSMPFMEKTEYLAQQLKKCSVSELQELLGVNDKLALINFLRYQEWDELHIPMEQAIFAFQGELFHGIKASTLSPDQLQFADDHICILSGLYGVIKPLDWIKAHRLEMNTKSSKFPQGNLYSYWSQSITQHLIEKRLQSPEEPIINLTSNEYFGVLKTQNIKNPIITPLFKDYKINKYKIIVIYAKKARGKMTRFIIDNKITNPEDLKAFESDGYYYNNRLSQGNNYVFTRGE